jgi:hypothetical protein
MVDGRPSYLSGPDLASMLRSMSASQLEQIEIMTNPPAKYDAAGNSGIINIKTKKNKQFGYSGSITTGYTQAHYARFNESGNFNYRNGKFNVFTSLNYNRNHRDEKLKISRNFIDPTTNQISSKFDQESKMENQNHFMSGKFGVDYNASKKTTLGLVVSGYVNPSIWQSTTNTSIFNPAGIVTSKAKSFSENERHWNNFSGNFNFRTQLDSLGQELSSDLDYVQYRSTNMQPLVSSYYDPNGNLKSTPDTLMGTLPQNITIYSGKVDYTKPLKKGAKFEAGIKTSYVETDNNASYDTLRNGNSIHDYNRSNHFIYQENVNAAYVNYSRPLGKKWSGQFGLRVENTISKGNQLTTAVKFTRNYTQLFPTVYLQYTANAKNQFVINYGRRINRPNYGDLNPFINFLDRYTFQQGNPDLKPQFSHNIELTHTYNGFLTTTINYSKTTDIIQQILQQNTATNETFMKKANIANRDQIGLTMSAQKEIKKWWTGNVYVNAAYNHFNGIVNNSPISLGLIGFTFQTQQQFKFGKGWGAEISGAFRSKALEGVLYIRSIKQVNVGFSKQVLKNKGTVKLNVRDIFQGSVFRGVTKYGDVDAQFTSINDSRAASISFSWRFNKGKLKAGAKERKSSAADEQQRVGN